jgi:hypothetical protein
VIPVHSSMCKGAQTAGRTCITAATAREGFAAPAYRILLRTRPKRKLQTPVDPRQHSQVKVLATDDDGVGHLGRVDDTGEDAATDGDIASEGALLV